MDSQYRAEGFIENSRHAIDHLFLALDCYFEVYNEAQATIQEIERQTDSLSDRFTHCDQWSPNANYYYAKHMRRVEYMEKRKKDTWDKITEDLNAALSSIDATVESMSCLAGTILQIAKQALSIRYGGKPDIATGKMVGTQSRVEVVWEGRNHAMHWDEGAPRKAVKDMLEALEKDLDIPIEAAKNNCLSILRALEWKTSEEVISDVKELVQ